MSRNNWFFAWPRMKCISMPVTEQVTTSFVLRNWWITMHYHWYASDQHISLKLWSFEISFSHYECGPPRLKFGPFHIKIRSKHPFGEVPEKFGFFKNPTPWKDCFVWQADLRILTIHYAPEWAHKARDHWEKVRQEYVKPPPITYSI